MGSIEMAEVLTMTFVLEIALHRGTKHILLKLDEKDAISSLIVNLINNTKYIIFIDKNKRE